MHLAVRHSDARLAFGVLGGSSLLECSDLLNRGAQGNESPEFVRNEIELSCVVFQNGGGSFKQIGGSGVHCCHNRWRGLFDLSPVGNERLGLSQADILKALTHDWHQFCWTDGTA